MEELLLQQPLMYWAALNCPCNRGDGRWRTLLGAPHTQPGPTYVFLVWLEDVWDTYGQFNHSKFKLNASCPDCKPLTVFIAMCSQE